MPRPLLALLLLVLPACATPGDGAPGLVACLVDQEVPITNMATIPDGFQLSPEAARSLVIGHWNGSLERHDGAVIALTLHTTATGDMLLQRRSWRSPAGSVSEPAAAPRTGAPRAVVATTASGATDDGLDAFACEDTYALPVELDLRASPDLDLQYALHLTVSASGTASFVLRIAVDEHAGSAMPAAEDLAGPGTVTAVEVLVYGERASGPWAGEVAFGIERRHGSDGGADATVSYSQSRYAAWSVQTALDHDAASSTLVATGR